jgi:hypothetical protein
VPITMRGDIQSRSFAISMILKCLVPMYQRARVHLAKVVVHQSADNPVMWKT